MDCLCILPAVIVLDIPFYFNNLTSWYRHVDFVLPRCTTFMSRYDLCIHAYRLMIVSTPAHRICLRIPVPWCMQVFVHIL